MPLDGLLGLGEMLCDCCCSESGPRDELPVFDFLVPCGLSEKSRRRVEIPNEFRLGLQFVDVVNGYRRCWAIWKILAGGSLDDDGVGVVVTDDGDEQDTP